MSTETLSSECSLDRLEMEAAHHPNSGPISGLISSSLGRKNWEPLPGLINNQLFSKPHFHDLQIHRVYPKFICCNFCPSKWDRSTDTLTKN